MGKLKLRKADILLIGFLLMLACLPLYFFPATPAAYGILKVNGTEKKRFELTTDQTYLYKAPDGDTNLIEVKNQQIRIKTASCPDQRCVKQRRISKEGETIVCLPHKLVVEIKGGEVGSRD